MAISSSIPGTTPMDVEKRFTALKEKYRRERKKVELSTRSGSGAATKKVGI